MPFKRSCCSDSARPSADGSGGRLGLSASSLLQQVESLLLPLRLCIVQGGVSFIVLDRQIRAGLYEHLHCRSFATGILRGANKWYLVATSMTGRFQCSAKVVPSSSHSSKMSGAAMRPGRLQRAPGGTQERIHHPPLNRESGEDQINANGNCEQHPRPCGQRG